MIVVDNKGNLFDERRKKERRTSEKNVKTDKRVKERRKDVKSNNTKKNKS